MASMNKATVEKLLKQYLECCKYKHAFAFLQFRKLLRDPKLHDLMAIFKHRKSLLLKRFDRGLELIKQGHLGQEESCSSDSDEDKDDASPE